MGSLQPAQPARNSLFSKHLITSMSHRPQPLLHVYRFSRVTCVNVICLVRWQLHFLSICSAPTTVSHGSGPLKKCCEPYESNESSEMSSWTPFQQAPWQRSYCVRPRCTICSWEAVKLFHLLISTIRALNWMISKVNCGSNTLWV